MPNSTYDWQRIFSAEIEHILFLNNKNLLKINRQSCDCDRILVKLKGRDDYLSFESDKGLFVVREIRSYDIHAFNLKHTPPKDANITFVKSRVFDDDDFDTEGLKFTYCDRHLYIFTEEDWLIITISISDILEEDDDTPEPGYEDSDLYLEKY